MTKDVYNPVTVFEFLTNSSDKLSEISNRVSQISRCQSVLRLQLGPPLAEHLNVANYSSDTLTLYTDSPAWASRLRFNTHSILDAARKKCGLQDLKSVRIKVIIQNTISKSSAQPARLSENTIKVISDTAGSINDFSLRSSLLNLCKHHV